MRKIATSRKYSRLAFILIRLAKTAYSNPNSLRYWLHQKTGLRFRPKAPKFPQMVLLESTNYCNFSCIHCAYRIVSKKPAYKQGFMDIDLYKKIIDEVSRYRNITLRPFSRGEALINPQLSQMIKYAKEKGIKNIWLNTNGLLLTPKKSKELLEAGLDRLEVSIDAASEKTFSRIKGVDGKILRTVIENTIRYYKLKEEFSLNNSKKRLVISFVESEMNTLEKDAFVNFWRNNADHVSIRPIHQHGALLSDDLRFPRRDLEAAQRLPCSILWERVSIDYCGNVTFCEFDWEDKGIVGSVYDSSIEELWNSKRYEQLRRLHVEKRFSKIRLCDSCKSYLEAGRWG